MIGKEVKVQESQLEAGLGFRDYDWDHGVIVELWIWGYV